MTLDEMNDEVAVGGSGDMENEELDHEENVEEIDNDQEMDGGRRRKRRSTRKKGRSRSRSRSMSRSRSRSRSMSSRSRKSKGKKTKRKGASKWIMHVKSYCKKHNMKFNEALKSKDCKKSYKN